jgi:hypothetical protein
VNIESFGGGDRASLQMHLEAMIEQGRIYTWRPTSSQLRDALGGHNGACLEMHSEDVIERVWRCTWKPGSCQIGTVLGAGRLEDVEEMRARC